jgi:hypothetical protein
MAGPPLIDARGYQELLDEALARIPVHNPEWTNFNRSDPGVTLLELFAFVTEALTYRANLIPERNRRKFLSLLGVPIAPASAARGIVAFTNASAPPEVVPVADGVEVRAGQIPFRAELGLDILPVEGRAFVKRALTDAPDDVRDYYRQLYASHRGEKPELKDVSLYETVPLDTFAPLGAPLRDTVDDSVWIALLLAVEPPSDESAREALRESVRRALAGRTLSLGLVPAVDDTGKRAGPGTPPGAGAQVRIAYQVPQPPPGGMLGGTLAERVATYRTLDAQTDVDVLAEPGIVQLALPSEPGALGLWRNLDPLEHGAGDFPPSLQDTTLEPRLVTWVRVRVPPSAKARLNWVGVNATTVTQRDHVGRELLGTGTGQPDQAFRLARTPVVAGSVSIAVGAAGERWSAIDDLAAAASELAPWTPGRPRPSHVFTVELATGEVSFGDGVNGERPPAETVLFADYAVSQGRAGVVAAGAIKTAPELTAGAVTVTNPTPTWGGADAETTAEAEKHAARFLQHRERLVTAGDFAAIARRTPGVEIGRLEVLPTFDPHLDPPAPTPGAVTVLVLPLTDPQHPGAPEPDHLFLDEICRYIDPRRLVTTEVFLRGPQYVDVWVSIGVEVEAGRSVAVVHRDVQAALTRFLAPLDLDAPDPFFDEPTAITADLGTHASRGWPLGKAVARLELVTVASRVPGVRLVSGANVAAGSGPAAESIPIAGLQLPRVRGIAVGGIAEDLDQLRGRSAAGTPPPGVVPVPVIPESC